MLCRLKVVKLLNRKASLRASLGRVHHVAGWIMSTDTHSLSSSHATLSAGRQTSLRAETCGQPQCLNRALCFCSSDSDFDEPGGVKGLFVFHDLKPSCNGFLYIADGLIIGLALRETAGRAGT